MTATPEKLHRPGNTTQGVLLLTFGQALLVAFGYVIHLVGTRLLTQADYGRFMTVLSIQNWLHVALTTLLVPGICKIVSESPGRLGVALKTAVNWHWACALAGFALLLAFAGRLAGVMGDAALAPLFLIVAIDLLFFSSYTLGRYLLAAVRHYVGAFMTLTAYSLLRAVSAVALLAAGFGAVGAMAGLGAGSLAGGALGMGIILMLRRRLNNEPYPRMVSRSWTWAMLTLPAGVGVITLSSMDIWLVKSLVPNAAIAGIYGAAFAASRLPDVMIQGLVNAIFPKVSHALAAGKIETARKVAAEAMRFEIITFSLVCAATAASAKGIMSLLFGKDYAEGHLLLTLLVISLSLSGILKLMMSLLSAADRPGRRLAFVAAMLPIGVALNVLFIRKWGAPGAALASLTTMFIAALTGGVLVFRLLGVLPPVPTLLRCAVAAACVFLIGAAWQVEGFLVLVKLAALSCAYMFTLFVLGELRILEVQVAILKLLGRARGPGLPAGLGGER